MPEPKPKVIISTDFVLMPIAAAISRFCCTARTRRPIGVLFISAQVKATTTIANRITAVRL